MGMISVYALHGMNSRRGSIKQEAVRADRVVLVILSFSIAG